MENSINKRYGLQIDKINELIKIFEKKYFKYFDRLNFLNMNSMNIENKRIIKIFNLYKKDIIKYSKLNKIKLTDTDIKDLFIFLIEKYKIKLIAEQFK